MNNYNLNNWSVGVDLANEFNGNGSNCICKFLINDLLEVTLSTIIVVPFYFIVSVSRTLMTLKN